MPETHWTPGPWGPYGGPGKGWEPIQGALEAAPGISVGSPANTEPVCRVHGYGHDVRANAQLIAQAPNLYRRLARRVTNCGCKAATGFYCLNCSADRKVLAKARGEGENDG